MPPFTPIIFMCKDFGKSLRYLSDNQRDGKAFSITYPVTIGGLKSSSVSCNSELVDFCPEEQT